MYESYLLPEEFLPMAKPKKHLFAIKEDIDAVRICFLSFLIKYKLAFDFVSWFGDEGKRLFHIDGSRTLEIVPNADLYVTWVNKKGFNTEILEHSLIDITNPENKELQRPYKGKQIIDSNGVTVISDVTDWQPYPTETHFYRQLLLHGILSCLNRSMNYKKSDPKEWLVDMLETSGANDNLLMILSSGILLKQGNVNHAANWLKTYYVKGGIVDELQPIVRIIVNLAERMFDCFRMETKEPNWLEFSLDHHEELNALCLTTYGDYRIRDWTKNYIESKENEHEHIVSNS